MSTKSLMRLGFYDFTFFGVVMELTSKFYHENQIAEMMENNYLRCKIISMDVILFQLSLRKRLSKTTSVAHSWLEG